MSAHLGEYLKQLVSDAPKLPPSFGVSGYGDGPLQDAMRTALVCFVVLIACAAHAGPATTRAVNAPAPTTRPALTPAQAIDSFAMRPREAVTVEFTVGSIGWLGWYPRNQRPPQIRLTAKD